jgi:hypothetical protein
MNPPKHCSNLFPLKIIVPFAKLFRSEEIRLVDEYEILFLRIHFLDVDFQISASKEQRIPGINQLKETSIKVSKNCFGMIRKLCQDDRGKKSGPKL